MPLNKSTTYHAYPPPLLSIFQPTYIPHCDKRDEAVILSHFEPPLSRLATSPRDPPSMTVVRKWEGVGVWPVATPPPPVVAALRQHFPMRHAQGVYVWVVVDVLLRSLTSLYGFWKECVPLTAAQISVVRAHTTKIGECWVKLGWESFSWVHWVVAHSAALLKRYGTLYIFSSLPFEHRHKPFKVAVTHIFRGWCLQKPRASRRGLGQVTGMEALDIGLRRQGTCDNVERHEAIRDRTKRHCHFV